jgi:glucokinase
MLLAGDVGGTKTNLAVFSPEAGPRALLAEATLPSARYSSLETLVRDFLTQAELRADWRIERASFGVAGPVVNGQAKITNLPWSIEETRLEAALGIPTVRLLNDLEAIANAVPYVEPGDLHTLSEGVPAPNGAIAIIAPGTGLGEAFLTWDGSHYRTHASEGGHAGFAPGDPLQTELLRYLQDRFDHVSCERVCSGLGLPNIYTFLKERGHAEEPAWLAEQLERATDPTPVIAKAALDPERRCELCVCALNVFVSILGAEAGDLALKVLATGGIYLGGGIPPRILPALEQPRFLEAFRRKGRFRDLLTQVPVHVILNPKVALLGAACHALEV